MEFNISTVLVLCCFTFLAGFIDSIAGGGGLISLPAYLTTGIPPLYALGSNKFSSSCGSLVSVIRFIHSKKVHFRSVGMSVVFALIGSNLGARAVQYVDSSVLKIMIVIIIPLVAFFVLIKKDFGSVNTSEQLSPKKVVLFSGIAGLVMGFYDGFFGPGTGTFLIYIYTVLMHFDLVTASGNAKVVNLASNLGALAQFLMNGQVVFHLALPAAIFGILGNFIGSGLAIKKGAKIIKPIFLVVLSLLIINVIQPKFFGSIATAVNTMINGN